jgi:hypothetical protein
MHRLRSPKICAALVMIAWLASLIAVWGMAAAGSEAIKDTSCDSKDLQNRSVQLEMAGSPAAVSAVLDGDPAKAVCMRAGVAAQVEADYVFIPAYSALALALFMFVRALRLETKGQRGTLLLLVGVLLCLTMIGGDVFENLQLTSIIEQADLSRLPILRVAAYVKMGALALASLILGAVWTSASGSRLVWLPRLFSFAAAALFLAGMIGKDWQLASRGMAAFAAMSFAGLIHAVAVAVGRGEIPALESRRV